MPIEAVIVMGTAWALGALTVLATQLASLRLGRSSAQQKRTVGLAALVVLFWIMSTGLLAASGKLADFNKVPPPFLVFLVVAWVCTFCVAFSAYGTLWMRGLTFPMLIGFQVFRVAAEAMLYFSYEHGLAPVQMTFDGWNFDIITGLTALPVAWAVGRSGSRRLILGWNILGLALLLTIVTIAMLSTPTIRAFATEPTNTFVGTFPYIWLPAVLVQYALLGHLLCFRKLWDTQRQ